MTLRTSSMCGESSGGAPAADDYIVQWLTAGRARILLDREDIRVPFHQPQLLPTDRPFRFTYQDYDQRIVHLSKDVITRAALERGVLDRHPLRTDHQQPTTPTAVATWRRSVHEMTTALARGHTTTLEWDSLTRQIASAFLELYPPTTATLSPAVRAPRQARLRAAIDYIHQHAGQPIGVLDIAHAAQLSVRGLEHAFRRILSTSPHAYLQQVRLEHAHYDLTRSNPHDHTVSIIAQRWGFTHTGRFAATYAQHFGQLPSTTLNLPNP